MNEAQKEIDLPALVRAIRFSFAALVAGISYPNIRLALYLQHFEQIFRDMLGDKPLPGVTGFVIHAQPFLIGTSILIPLFAVALLFSSSIVRSLYLSGILLVTVFVQLFATWHAVMAPLVTVAQGMQAP